MKKIYFDYNGTTPIDPKVLDAMLPYLQENYGNSSSIHSFGNKAKAALDESREKVASLLGAKSNEIFFTSGGTECNNWAIKGVAFSLSNQGNHLITTSVEHASCLETFKFLENRGFEVTYLPVDSNGIVDLVELRKSITDKTTLISCIHVNNETGVITPIEQIGEIANEAGILFHTDSVQAVGKLDFSFKDLPVDLASISAHKIYGPKGVGALYIRKGSSIESYLHGGGQERGKRSGTENVSGIYGFGMACELLDKMQIENKRILKYRDLISGEILQNIEGTYINGDMDHRVCNTLNIGFDYVNGESLVMNLDLEGIATSTGSACSEGNVDPSHVLLAMGLTKDDATSSLRISLGRFTQSDEVDSFLKVLPRVVKRIREFREF